VCALFRHGNNEEQVELWEETTWLKRHRGRLWRTVALALWGGTLLWFYFADRLILYNKPIYHPFALAAGFVLSGLAVFGFVRLVSGHGTGEGDASGDETEHGHVAGRLAAMIVIVPLAVNALVPSTGLTSYAVGKRATDVDFSTLAGELASDWEAQLAEAEHLDQEYPELSVAQMLTLASQEQAHAEGRKFSCIGFVYHKEELPQGIFMLVRFRMWCCAADAQPMYLPVRWHGAADLEGDQWVKVRGTLTYSEIGGRRAPLLEADYVDDIKRPHNQYM